MLITIQSLKERRIAIYREGGREEEWKRRFSSTAEFHVLTDFFSSYPPFP
jgi:hypothetical protein